MNVHVRVELAADGPVVIKSGSGPARPRLRHERERLEQARHPGVVALVEPATRPAARSGPSAAAAPGADGDATDPDRDHDRDHDHDEVRTAYAGDPVSNWTGSLAGIAGVGAAVASTLADLHDLGIVHGRIDASHILIGGDGRPRLCGFSHDGDGTPADDVTALAEVLRDLVARARPERHGPLTRLRAAKGTARPLRQVIDRATDPVASRRPSARGLADAILAAVPRAVLPPAPVETWAAGAADCGQPDRAAPTEPDTLDRIWAFADQRSDAERWAAAFGEGPPDRSEAASLASAVVDSAGHDRLVPDPWATPPDGHAGLRDDAVDAGSRSLPVGDAWADVAEEAPGGGDNGVPDRSGTSLGAASHRSIGPSRGDGPATGPVPIAHIVTPSWAATRPADPDDRSRPSRTTPRAERAGGPRDHPAEPAAERDVPWPEIETGPGAAQGDAGSYDPWALDDLGDRDRDAGREPEGDVTRGRPRRAGHTAAGFDLEGGRHDGHDDGHDDGRRDGLHDGQDDGLRGGHEDLLVDELTRDHRVVGGRVAPTARPSPDDGSSSPSTRWRRTAALAVVAAVTAGALVGGALVAGDDTGRSEPNEEATPTGCPPTQPPRADVDGDSCPEALVVEGTTVAAGGAQWAVGEAGDLVTVGDWDCDGDASAALLRPATGDVFVFGAWAPPDQPVTVSASQQVAGGVGIRAEAAEGTCDSLVVDLAGGGSATVEVAP